MTNPAQNLHPVLLALLGTCFTWGMTALGAAVVFTRRSLGRKVLDTMLGFAAGAMIAASFWSLLAPAIEMAKGQALPAWFPATVGFLLGGLALCLADRLLPHLHVGYPLEEAEGVKTTWRQATLLMLAITMHNFPERLAVGVAFGAVAAGLPSATLPAAVALTIGLGIQNLPEGMAVALPVRRAGASQMRSFWYGQLSGAIEPIAGVLGAAIVITARAVLPYALAFAAGAMIFVVIEEVIPEAQHSGNTDLTTLGAMLGFAGMMVLDVGLG